MDAIHNLEYKPNQLAITLPTPTPAESIGEILSKHTLYVMLRRKHPLKAHYYEILQY